MNNPWETPDGQRVFKTKAGFMNYIRGGIRKGLWMRHPLKIEFTKNNRKRVPLGRKTESNPQGMVWGAECSSCHNDFRSNDVIVDHIIGNHSLKDTSDLDEFIKAMVYFDPRTDLQFMCKECHNIKSYADRHNITFNEAKVEKDTIAIMKGSEKDWLLDKGIKPASNAKARRSQVKDYLLKHKE